MTSGRGSICGIQCTPSRTRLELLEELAELPVDLRGVRGARAQHDLGGRVDVADGAQQMGHALLAGDAADEQDVRAVGVDADAVEDVRAVVGAVQGGVDAVVHDVHLGRVEGRIAGEDVLAHGAGDGDHGVGGLDRGALGPARQGVAAAELLGLPGAQRLQGVGGHHVRDAVQQLARGGRRGWRTRCGSGRVRGLRGRRPWPGPRRRCAARRWRRRARARAGGAATPSAAPSPQQCTSRSVEGAATPGRGTRHGRPRRRTRPAGTPGSAGPLAPGTPCLSGWFPHGHPERALGEDRK